MLKAKTRNIYVVLIISTYNIIPYYCALLEILATKAIFVKAYSTFYEKYGIISIDINICFHLPPYYYTGFMYYII